MKIIISTALCPVFVTASASVASAGKAVRETAGSSRAAVAVAAKSASRSSQQRTARSSQSLVRVLREGSRSEKATEYQYVEIGSSYFGAGSDGTCEYMKTLKKSDGDIGDKDDCQTQCDADADCTAFVWASNWAWCAWFKGLCDTTSTETCPTSSTGGPEWPDGQQKFWFCGSYGKCNWSQDSYDAKAGPSGPADDACPAEYENAPRPDGDANLDAAPTDSDTGVIAITDVGTVAGCSQACDADDSCVAMETDAAKCVTYDNTFDDGGSKKAQYILCKRIPPAVLKIQKVAAFVTEGLAYLADNVVDGSTKIEDAVALSTAIAETKVAALKALADDL